MRGKTNVVAWVVAVIIVIVIVVGAWLWRHQQTAPATTAPVAVATTPAAAATTPVIVHPIAQAVSAPATASTAPLPSLGQSDAAVTAALARLTGDAAIGKLLANADLIQRIVATIDALPRQGLGSNVLPLVPPTGAIATETVGGGLVLAPSNYARYAPYMAWVDHADAGQLVAWYVHYYPLFQQAYRDLGFPNGYFNDRLVVVIDDLLKAPEPAQPPALVHTDKGYAFADPQLEALSVGQKLLLRMGPANEQAIKRKLRAIRTAVTGQHGPAAAATTPPSATTTTR